MKIIVHYIIICSVILVKHSLAQPIIEWQNTIAADKDDALSSVSQTNDGGYILGGASNSNISGDKAEGCLGGFDFWIIKIDAFGNIQWQNTIGGTLGDGGYDVFNPSVHIQQTLDGGYLLGAESISNISGDKTENSEGNYDYWIVKLDSAGNIQWQNTIGGSDDDFLNSIQQTVDGGYALAGSSLSNISGDKTENSNGNYDYWVIKLDTGGNIEWQNSIGGNDYDDLGSMQQTFDKGFILGGYSLSNSSGDKSEDSQGSADYWVVKIDSIGIVQWDNTIGGAGADILRSIKQTTDGGFIAGGYSASDISGDKTEAALDNTFYGDFWVIKFNETGDIVWQNTMGGSDWDILSSIYQTAEGGYIISGSSRSDSSADKTENHISGGIENWEDYWIVKLDTSGNIQWDNTIGGSYQDYLLSISQTDDKGYILGGWSFSNVSGDKTENNSGLGPEYWVIKLSTDSLTYTSVPDLHSQMLAIHVFPNPFSTSVTISFTPDKAEKILIQVFDLNGRVISTLADYAYVAGEHFIKWNAQEVSAGIYLLKLQTASEIETVRLSVVK